MAKMLIGRGTGQEQEIWTSLKKKKKKKRFKNSKTLGKFSLKNNVNKDY